jgi:hypothetical protein
MVFTWTHEYPPRPCMLIPTVHSGVMPTEPQSCVLSDSSCFFVLACSRIVVLPSTHEGNQPCAWVSLLS